MSFNELGRITKVQPCFESRLRVLQEKHHAIFAGAFRKKYEFFNRLL